MVREFRAGEEREKDRFAYATVIAYQTVRVWASTKGKKKMPTFESLIPKRKGPVRPQSLGEQLNVIHTIAKRYGGIVGKEIR